MTSTKARELRVEIEEHAAQVRAAHERVKARGGAGATDDEVFDANQHLARIIELKRRYDTEVGDETTRTFLRDLSDGIGLSDGPAPVGDRRTKALGGTSWGAEVLAAHKDRTGQTKALTPAGSLLVTVPLAVEPVTDATPVYSVRQLIPAEADQVGRFSFMRQTLREHNAAAVAPGARKPTSRYSMVRVDGRAVTIAHISEGVARQDISDAPMLQSFVDSEMRAGIEEEIERQIVSGDGLGENFEGLATVSGTQVQAWQTDALTTTRSALTKLEIFGMAGTGWLLHPQDWQIIELASNSAGFVGAQAGQGTPIDRMARRLWGIPVVPTVAVPPGTGYLADFSGSTRLWVREEANLTWSENLYDPDAFGIGLGASDWERNLVRFRVEGRFGFAVTRPMGVVEIDLSAA